MVEDEAEISVSFEMPMLLPETRASIDEAMVGIPAGVVVMPFPQHGPSNRLMELLQFMQDEVDRIFAFTPPVDRQAASQAAITRMVTANWEAFRAKHFIR